MGGRGSGDESILFPSSTPAVDGPLAFSRHTEDPLRSSASSVSCVRFIDPCFRLHERRQKNRRGRSVSLYYESEENEAHVEPLFEMHTFLLSQKSYPHFLCLLLHHILPSLSSSLFDLLFWFSFFFERRKKEEMLAFGTKGTTSSKSKISPSEPGHQSTDSSIRGLMQKRKEKKGSPLKSDSMPRSWSQTVFPLTPHDVSLKKEEEAKLLRHRHSRKSLFHEFANAIIIMTPHNEWLARDKRTCSQMMTQSGFDLI